VVEFGFADVELLDQLPVVFEYRSTAEAAEEVRAVERVVPTDRVAFDHLGWLLPIIQNGNAIQFVFWFDPRGSSQGRIEIRVHRRFIADSAAANLGRPLHNERHANATLIQLTLAAPQRCVRGDVGFTTIVTGEYEDRILQQVQIRELRADLANALVDPFEHRGEMRIVIDGPVIAGIAFAQTSILADVAVLPP